MTLTSIGLTNTYSSARVFFCFVLFLQHCAAMQVLNLASSFTSLPSAGVIVVSSKSSLEFFFCHHTILFRDLNLGRCYVSTCLPHPGTGADVFSRTGILSLRVDEKFLLLTPSVFLSIGCPSSSRFPCSILTLFPAKEKNKEHDSNWASTSLTTEVGTPKAKMLKHRAGYGRACEWWMGCRRADRQTHCLYGRHVGWQTWLLQ